MPELDDVRVSRLQQLAADLAWPGACRTAQFQIGWMLFRSEANPDHGDPCWSAIVRRDLQSMNPIRRAAWLALLDSNDHDYPFSTAEIHSTLLHSLGIEEIEAGLLSWTLALVETEEPVLSHAGVTLLAFLVRICGALNSDAADEALYRIACAKWWSISDCDWVAAYLPVVGNRPPHRAFACLEALMMNPVTASIGDVSRTYHATLNLSLLEVSDAQPPDGYPVRTPEHLRLSEFLKASEPSNWRNSPSLPGIADPMEPIRRSLLEQSKVNPKAWLRAIAERYAWLRRHRARFAPDMLLFWRVELRKLLREAGQNICFENSTR